METKNLQETNSLDQIQKQERSSSQSPLSSPSHEFSFTITLHPSPSSTPNTTFKRNKDNTSSSSSFALDLSPADDIFLHGHLLPLHLLSHPPISPRPSTDVLTTKDIDHSPPLPQLSSTTNDHSIFTSCDDDGKEIRKKSNPFSSLLKLSKWFEDKKKKKVFVDVKHFLKKYASVVEPLFFSKRETKGKRDDLRPRPCSFSGNSNPKEIRDVYKWMRRRGEFSAPASMRTSPTNSGLLLATPSGYSSSNESSMEELQNAIQAAIAHCKNSTTATN